MTTTTTTPALADLDLLNAIKLAGMWAAAEHKHARNLARGGPGLAEQVEKAEAAACAAIEALAHRTAQPVAPVQAETNAAKAVYWFSILEKCHRLLELSDDEPIPSGVLRAVVEIAKERLAAPSPQVAEGAELPIAGWARKRDNGTGFGNWLFQTKEGAEKHGEPGDGYSVVALVERDAIATPAPASAGQAAPALPDALLATVLSKLDEYGLAVKDDNDDWRLRVRREINDALLAAQPAEGAGQADEVARLREDLDLANEHLRQAVESIAKFRAGTHPECAGQAGRVAMSRCEVLAICDAYESGMGHGLQKDGHKSGRIWGHSACGTAYEIGYQQGEARATERAAAPADALDAARYREACAEGGRIHIDWSASKEEIDARLDESLATHQPSAQESCK